MAIKIIIFDLDGVLVSTKDLHFKALNNALIRVGANPIVIEEHLSIYDGLTTRQKLTRLIESGKLHSDLSERVWILKQLETTDLLESTLQRDERLIAIFDTLKSQNYKLFVATNSIRETTETILSKLGILDFLDGYFTNNDVGSPKPHPEIYLRCMIAGRAAPEETLIIEDSVHGIIGATRSGAYIMDVEGPHCVTIQKILEKVNRINNLSKPFLLHKDKMNILIPMAGAGSRFEKAGYTFPKPLIDVNGKTMIQTVVESLGVRGNFIYVVNAEHYEKYNLKHFLNLITPECKIVIVDKLTEGAACTTLLAKEHINNDEELLMANSDQFIRWSPTQFFYRMNHFGAEAGILTFEATHPKWSYAKVNSNGLVTEVAEKKPISNLATVGIYYWKRGSDYVKYAEQMITKNIRVNDEFYVCPVFNEAIADGKKVRTFDVEEMSGLGTPEDLQTFLKNH
jgi:HAD superfamily hydrolase (TIGR01509 family)